MTKRSRLQDRQTAELSLGVGHHAGLTVRVELTSAGLVSTAVLVSSILLSTAVIVRVALASGRRGGPPALSQR